MRNIYIRPALSVQDLHAGSMIATSGEGFNTTMGTQGVSGDEALVKEDCGGFYENDVWRVEWDE